MSVQTVTSETSTTVEPERAVGLVRDRAWALAVWGAMFAWCGVLFVIVRGSYVNFREGRFDLGNMVQAVWSTAHGHPLEITHGATAEQIVRLGGHVDPFLVLLTPLWLVWPSPLALAFAQVAVVALGALPVFWLGRRHLDSEAAAALLAIGYLAYPWTATSAAASIHPVTFAIPFFLFCVYFLDTKRLGLFAVFALLAMSTGELMGLPIAFLGICPATRRSGSATARSTTATTRALSAQLRRRSTSPCAARVRAFRRASRTPAPRTRPWSAR